MCNPIELVFRMKCPRWFWLLAFVGVSQHPLFAGDVVFAGYNIENYAPIPSEPESKGRKSEEAATSVVKVVGEIRPDILGLSEMGSELQFADFKRRLGDVGLVYDEKEWVDGPDSDRHLALLSRLPIVSRQSLPDVSYDADGKREKVRRGFLDVTIQVTERQSLRVVGAHLKSKLANRHEEALMRRLEAHLLRHHIESILQSDPEVKLLVFGDFNDTKNQPAVQQVSGRPGAADFLNPLALEDSVGDRWTHYWKVDDTYQRIDYIFVNRNLSPAVKRDKSYVYRSPFWNLASDHRPLVAVLHFAN